jgi:hypothetical protein
MKKVRKNPTGPSIRLKSRKPTAKMTMPTRIKARGPKRSVSQPWIGPRMPLSARAIENAAESVVLLQPNSSRSSTAYAPYA